MVTWFACHLVLHVYRIPGTRQELLPERPANRIPGHFVILFSQDLGKYYILYIFQSLTSISRAIGPQVSSGPTGRTALPTAHSCYGALCALNVTQNSVASGHSNHYHPVWQEQSS